MRAAQAIDHVTAQVREAFDDDVADAIIADTDLFEAAARRLDAGTAQQITDTIAGIAGDVEDGLADWLVEQAEAPGGWFFRQAIERI